MESASVAEPLGESPAALPVAYEAPLILLVEDDVTLSGVVRGVPGVVVQKRSSGTAWKRLRAIAPGPFSFSVKPKVTTQYRLATAQDAAASVRIRVGAATVK